MPGVFGGEVKLDRSNWEVRPIPEHGKVLTFLERWHYAKGGPNTSTERHGLYRLGGAKLFGVTLWLPPTKVAAQSVAGDDWRSVLCLSRLAVHPVVPQNGASFLLGKSMKLVDRSKWKCFLTYADTYHGHTGAIYRATNWDFVGETKAGDVWVDENGKQAGRKRGKFSYTPSEMIEMGYRKLPHAKKLKFVYRP